jgi:hypothetical protein
MLQDTVSKVRREGDPNPVQRNRDHAAPTFLIRSFSFWYEAGEYTVSAMRMMSYPPLGSSTALARLLPAVSNPVLGRGVDSTLAARAKEACGWAGLPPASPAALSPVWWTECSRLLRMAVLTWGKGSGLEPGLKWGNASGSVEFRCCSSWRKSQGSGSGV